MKKYRGAFAVAICLSLPSAADSMPVEDFRAADRIFVELFSGTNTAEIEYSFLGLRWYSLDPEPVGSEPGCIDKTPGTLDMDLNPLIPEYELPGLVAHGSEHPGDIVAWELDDAMDQDVEMEYNGTPFTITITHADIRLTAQLESVPVFYGAECRRVFNVTIHRYGGNNENYMNIDFYMDEEARTILANEVGLEPWMASALTGHGRMKITDIDFQGTSGAGTPPTPQAVQLKRNGEDVTLTYSELMVSAPYILEYTTDLIEPNWADVENGEFQAGDDTVELILPLHDDPQRFYRLKLDVDHP